MATSGSWDYSRTATQIITAAFENIGVVQPGVSVGSADSAMALVRLNLIAKQYQGDAYMGRGLQPYHRQTITLMLAKGQQSYLIGPASTDARASTQVGRTTLSAAEAIGQTTISITSNTDTTTYPGTTLTMANTNFVGIEQNDGTIHWSTISGTPGATMTIADATTVAANSGNYVWWFASRAQRFPVIESATLRDENYSETVLNVYRDVREYQQGVSDKYADGDPTSILVEPLRITTRVILDSQPTDVTKQIILYALYPAEDYDDAANDIAFPQEWYGFLTWELALQLSPVYGIPWTPDRERNYQNAKNIALSFNPETCDLYFRPG